MNEATLLDEFSALDDWAPTVPAWQVYRTEAPAPCSIDMDCAG
jgi:hypothetical protein